MRFVHISDLHIGKKLYGYDLTEDQRHVFDEIIDIIKKEKGCKVLISGDIYDRADPSAKAVGEFDRFLEKLSDTGSETFLIYGNHDSPERASFGSGSFKKSGIHISPVFDGDVERIPLEDEFGEIDVYMLPYLKKSDAVEALEKLSETVDVSHRNVILSHQFVTGSRLGGSEEINVGTADNIDVSLYEAFDYAALGHLHVPQDVGTGKEGEAKKLIGRYSGSPLAYSFQEAASGDKSVTVADLKKKGEMDIRLEEIEPLHRMATLKGSFEELIGNKKIIDEHKDDYLRVILTDESEIMDAMSKLELVYPYCMTMEYEFISKREGTTSIEEVEEFRSPGDLFGSLYEEQHGKPLDKEQKEVMDKLIRELWEEDNEAD